MSSTLWQYFLHDDVESFQRFLSRAARASSPWSRAQVNARDPDGRTLLHLIASSPRSSAIDFANAWLAIPGLDLYAQDVESGWTALHRALYAGNAAVARAVLARDVQAATDFSSPGGAHHRPGGLLQMKDREGNRPWDVYRATVPARDRMPTTASGGFPAAAVANPGEGDPSASEGEEGEAGGTRDGRRPMGRPRRNWHADEVGTFGSNKNLTLGLGDADDRQFPERIVLSRPEHLLRRFDREWEESRGARRRPLAPDADRRADRPFLIKSRPIVVQDLIMSKLHTAVVTDDPESNLWMCGVGPGGRLGTGDGSTRFGWVCIETGALAGKNVVAVALGQDHSIAVSGPGEVFTWGSNQHGQLGYRLPPADNRNDHPIQGTPRQIFNPFKGEIIIGAAASAIHSVVFTATGLYTFGKNDGQLGLVDSDARSLEMQVTPRRVGGSLFNSPIQMVSAIDRATAVLLESHDVWVFTQYGYSRVTFPLDARAGWTRNRRSATRYRRSTNHIIKVVSGGNTIGAMSSFGEVYTVEVTPRPVPSSMAASTTNPAKIRHSLSSPVRVWSVKKSPMAATDVDIGQGGSVIIGTQSGSAWREEKRAKIKEAGPKDSRFVRVPGLSRVVGVRSNAFGAYAVAQRDCEVTEKIKIDPSSLWNDYFHLLPFMKLAVPSQDSISLGRRALLREERSFTVHDHLRSLHAAVLSSPDIESQIQADIQAQDQWSNPHPGMVWMASSGSHVQIPTHEFILSARSPVLRKALAEFQLNHSFTIPDVLVMERMENGQTQVWFHGLDFLSILNLVLLMYTDRVLDLWRSTRPSHSDAFRYRQVRTEVMRIATHLELRTPERAPTTSLNIDMESALVDPSFFESSDVRIELNGGSAHAHSQVICQRCPFFGGLFRGRSGGRWLASRRDDGAPDKITVDLKDIDFSVFAYVLRHLYADTGTELFEDVKSDSLDEFMNLILDVMSAANELMIDRLSQICQKMLGRFVNTRNVCQLLNVVAPFSVTEFKDAALQYMCLNLEVILENRLLDDLNEDLLAELVEHCQENQFACYPISRSRNSENFLFERYPELVSLVERDRQRRIDYIKLRSRPDKVESPEERLRSGAPDRRTSFPSVHRVKATQPGEPKPPGDDPVLKQQPSTGDLIFPMDEDGALATAALRTGRGPSARFISEDLSPTEQCSHAPKTSTESKASLDYNSKRGYFDNGLGFPIDTTMAEKTSSRAPWATPITPTTSKDLRDIMAETKSKVSNLTPGMSDRRHHGLSGSFSPKLTQKERKRLQQEQQQQQQQQHSQENSAIQQDHSSPLQSPWQTPTKQPGSIRRESLVGSDQVKTAQKPSMTLRQTVAGTPPAKSNTGPNTPQGPVSSVPNAPPLRLQSVRPTQNSTRSTASPTALAQPAIQSIRHSPRQETIRHGFTSSSSGQLSLASILLQQQAEKDEIREAATTKHSLQDIQLEQEFQEWWDNESRRVMQQAEAEAEEAAAAATGKRTRGRGQRKGRENRVVPTDSIPNSIQQLGKNRPEADPLSSVTGGDHADESGGKKIQLI